MDSSGTFKAEPAEPRTNQEFIIVSHSLGSYLIFSALDVDQPTAKTATVQQSASSFKQVLERTSSVYFFANQLRLLELAALDGASERNIETHLDDWARLRCEYLKSLPAATQECKPRITALNDPSDLLTWTVPSMSAVDVENYSVKNSPHWFWLFENPTKAHNGYANDKRAIKEMLKSDSDVSRQTHSKHSRTGRVAWLSISTGQIHLILGGHADESGPGAYRVRLGMEPKGSSARPESRNFRIADNTIASQSMSELFCSRRSFDPII